MNYNLRCMRGPDIYIDGLLADFEVLPGGIRHWLDWDGAHYFAEDIGDAPLDGVAYQSPFVLIGTNGDISVNAGNPENRWLARRGYIKKLTYIDPQGTRSLFPFALIRDHEKAITTKKIAKKIANEINLEIDRKIAIAKSDLKQFTAWLIETGDFATLGLLAKSLPIARRMLSETSQDTSRAIQLAVEKSAEACGGLPSRDAVWQHFSPTITEKGFDNALTVSGFGWLPRSSNIPLEKR